MKRLMALVLLTFYLCIAMDKLEIAIQDWRVKDVESLLKTDKNCDVNAKFTNGKTPLMTAIEEGTKECFDVIMKQDKIDVDLKDNRDQTAMHYAAKNDEMMCVELARRADVNAKDNRGTTPLMIAAVRDRLKCVKALLENKANIEEKNTNGITAMAMAEERGYKEIVEVFRMEHTARHFESVQKQKATIQQEGETNRSNLSATAGLFIPKNPITPSDLSQTKEESKGSRFLKGLVKKLATIQQKGETNRSNLSATAGLLFIPENPITPSDLSQTKRTEVSPNISKTLTEKISEQLWNAMLGAISGSGEDSKQSKEVCEKQSKEVCEKLLSMPAADVNAMFYGRTALMEAIIENNRSCFDVILNHPKTNFNLRELEKSWTALHYAAKRTRDEADDYMCVELAKRADVNAKTSTGFTPLMFAVAGRKLECVKALLEYKADASIEVLIGNTKYNAFSIAEKKGYEEIVDLLPKKKPSIDKINKN